jgi:valyl-tRNA synthetase
VIRKYGADAIRWWAASSHLGHDQRYDEQEVRAGRKLAMKLWNAARFAEPFVDCAEGPPVAVRDLEDRWLLSRLDDVNRAVIAGFDAFDYASGREALDRWFWADFCDDWLELVKDRLYQPERHPELAVRSARATLREVVRTSLGLFAPYVPFTTEAIWQRLFRDAEGGVSLHLTRFPEPRGGLASPPEIDGILEILRLSRAFRTEHRIGQSRLAEAVALHPDLAALPERSILAAARATGLEISSEERLSLRFAP